MNTSLLAARAAATHAAAVLLGALGALTLQSSAQTAAETMLNNAPVEDLESLRTYLSVKANDLQAYQASMQERIVALEKQIATLEQGTSSRTVMAPFVIVDQKRRKILEVREDGDARGLIVYDTAAKPVILASTDTTGPSIELTREESSLQLAVTEARTGVRVELSSKEAAFIGNEPESHGFVRLSNAKGETVVGFGANENDNGELEISGGKATGASLRASANDNGGYLTVNNLAGKPFAGMRATQRGGSLEITGPTGEHAGARLSMDDSGGQLNLFPVKGGRARAAVKVDGDGGALNLWDSGGAEIRARLSSNGTAGAGLLEIGNATGDVVVSAGATRANGVGFVSTGPFDGGVAGTMGGGLTAASSLLGRKNGGKE